MMPAGELLARAMSRTVFTLLLLATAALLAMAIGAMGIYGVIAYLVSLRTREMGLRLALGARPADVRRLVTRHALLDTALGLLIGVSVAVASMRVLATLLFGVRPTDPVALGGAMVVVVVAAVMASWLPARRAAHLDPAIALRLE
jgi:ABC-type antimicrobial peptide transport system permease subunit